MKFFRDAPLQRKLNMIIMLTTVEQALRRRLPGSR